MNEALLKFLCHNICVLTQPAYEMGMEPIFGQEPLASFGAKPQGPSVSPAVTSGASVSVWP